MCASMPFIIARICIKLKAKENKDTVNLIVTTNTHLLGKVSSHDTDATSLNEYKLFERIFSDISTIEHNLTNPMGE